MTEVIVHGAGLSGTLVAYELLRQSRMTSRAARSSDKRDGQPASDPAVRRTVFDSSQELRSAFHG